MKAPNPWHPMDKPIDLKHLGKLIEELGECTQAASRCLIQGIDKTHPNTGKANKEWLEQELADVLANITLVCVHFNLDLTAIANREHDKMIMLEQWHVMA